MFSSVVIVSWVLCLLLIFIYYMRCGIAQSVARISNAPRPLRLRHGLSACAVGSLRGPCRPCRCVPIRCNTCQSSVCGKVRYIRSLALHDSPCILPASNPAFFRASSRSCSSFMQYSVRRLYSFCKALKSSRSCSGV